MEVLVRDIIDNAAEKLKKAEIMDYAIDVWFLAEFVFGVKRTDLYIHPDITVSKEKAAEYMKLIDEREAKVPLQYLTGTQEFMGLTFHVNENVLIPRQDTEILVEQTIKHISGKELKVLDMCTGSGCIAIAIDKFCKKAEVTGADISHKALEVAKKNNLSNGANVAFVQTDLFENISQTFDVIVSNPPYIKSGEINGLMDEVRKFEPVGALDGDWDGLKFYRQICRNALKYLNKNGMIFFEIGYDQGQSVPQILQENGFKDIKVIKDLSGNDRVVIAGKE